MRTSFRTLRYISDLLPDLKRFGPGPEDMDFMRIISKNYRSCPPHHCSPHLPHLQALIRRRRHC